MTCVAAAVSLARTLVRLANRAGHWSVVATTGPGTSTVRLHVADGCLLAVDGVEADALGDTLIKWGALDLARHRAALERGEPRLRVGRWLVSVGAASADDVHRALKTQLAERLTRLLRAQEVVVQRVWRIREVASPHVLSVRLLPVVLDALVDAYAQLPERELRARTGQGLLRMTRRGSAALSELTSSAARHPYDFDGASRAHPEAPLLALRSSACELGWLSRAPVDTEADAYALLLRKHRELARNVSAERFLDLAEGASARDARVALRRLAARLHPDRFCERAPALTPLVNDVMVGLCRAASEVSTRLRQSA